MIKEKFQLSTKQIEMFDLYYNFLIEENQKYNLTAITKEEEVYIKHFYDSLILTDYVVLNDKSVCDIGSGAGFPIIPLKILIPDLNVTIIEPTQKRINFLKILSEKLNLNKIVFLNKRAEDIIKDEREQFNIVTSRAVSPLPILLEISVPYLKTNGLMIALKGANYTDEITLSKDALKKLNCVIVDIKEYQLPDDFGKRSLIIIKKLTPTNIAYPRRFSEIKKKPL